MRNIILLTVIPLMTIILIMNVNYIFADTNDQSENDKSKDIDQENNQGNQCKIDAKCDNTSLEQLNTQGNQCKDNAKCINESISNIIVCKERSLCLMQYEGPFKLLNPY
jgi:competence protein ComGC